ncbi:Mu transposase domain-containing protein [Amycolatopsis jejuensis]|uniref:Mu transposase domain-containing protein n=1 Tax=Amycolatopsis jejuensis TaxID=330084 RepID=UPI003CCBB92B
MAFPAEFDVPRTVTAQALVSFRGNHYSVPPGLGGAVVHVRHRLGADAADHHRRRGDGRGPPPRPGRRGTGDPRRRACRRAGEGRARRVHHRSSLHPQDPPAAVGGGVGRSGTTARPARDGARGPRRDRPVRLHGHRRPARRGTHR